MGSSESSVAVTRVVGAGYLVRARGTIVTGRRIALIHFRGTLCVGEACWTDAGEPIDEIGAGCAIGARLRDTLVNVLGTTNTCKSRGAVARK